MHTGIRSQEPCIFSEINNYHPSYLGKSFSELFQIPLNLNDCQVCIAAEYGFGHWTEVEQHAEPYHHHFEEAVNHLVFGREQELTNLLNEYPNLVHQTSQYGHQATLLHYSGSNGVELWRQQVPMNLPEIVGLLLENGANRHAKMKVYGGEFKTLELLMSSAHPQDAGLVQDLEAAFRK